MRKNRVGHGRVEQAKTTRKQETESKGDLVGHSYTPGEKQPATGKRASGLGNTSNKGQRANGVDKEDQREGKWREKERISEEDRTTKGDAKEKRQCGGFRKRQEDRRLGNAQKKVTG